MARAQADSAGAPAAAPAPARTAAPAGVPEFDHVIVVIMENKKAERALDPRTSPFTSKFASTWLHFEESYAITHPSQPNYIALWAGSTLGVTSNACPPPGTPFDAENLGHALEAVGKTWRAYSEDLPDTGSTVCDANRKLYTRKHAPWTHFSNLNHANERPYTDLAEDIAKRTLPHLAFVVPNNCHNTHDCPVPLGDVWLSTELPRMLAALGPRGLLVLTYDEDDYGAGNHILTVFAGLPVRGLSTSARRITHYTLLRTLCDGLRIAPFGEAKAESPITGVWYLERKALARPER